MIGEKGDYIVYDCLNCRTLFTSEKVNTAAFDYDNYYHSGNLTVPGFVLERLAEIVRSFEKYRSHNRFLDVGCGAGTLLNIAGNEGWQAEGVEISKPSVEFLQSKGIKVFHGYLSSANFPDDSFDVITAVEILEHITNPEDVIKEINRILRPGGLFWATTPHGRGISARMLGSKWSCVAPPEHLHLFSVTGIKNMLTENGFDRIKILTQGTNPFEIIHTLRQNTAAGNAAETENNYNPVESAYEINASLSSSRWRKAVKGSLNGILNLTKMGDSLKIWAEK